ncbi:hypothetical protein RGQ13_00565 [Thalassotalea psychrophila]|uniref:Uncharacterized protein n=1 Tax=Thalassotalea psychrophila TaxID=3065647 RepID=A0ABY9TUT9_9GAMM|nr:hypothetical protein RGQ13_00565 [Colwelliaceae bacterium SQ149]
MKDKKIPKTLDISKQIASLLASKVSAIDSNESIEQMTIFDNKHKSCDRIVLDALRDKSLKECENARTAKYKAVALTYGWLKLAMANEAYISQVFKPYANQENSCDFANAAKYCMGLCQTNQAEIINYTKDCLLFIDSKHSDTPINSPTDIPVIDIVSTIKSNNGIRGCQRKYQEYLLQNELLNKDDSTPTETTTTTVNKGISNSRVKVILRNYTKLKAGFLGEFKTTKEIEVNDVAIGSCIYIKQGDSYKVITSTSDKKAIEALVKIIHIPD